MKLSLFTSILLGVVVCLVSGYLLLLSGIWYLLVISGIFSSLLIRGRWKVAFPTAFFSGIILTAIYVILLPISDESAVMNEVGILAGFSPILLFAIMFLISGVLMGSGALIGNLLPFSGNPDTTISADKTRQ
ncbi:MAG: hypothetical protein AAE987_04135 [Thermoplasmataceae archaeon]|jgi:hypothetical protein